MAHHADRPQPFGAKAERGYGGGLSEYWQGAAYDTYRSALRNATAQREAARQQNQSQVSQAETAYTLGLMEVERERQAALSELEADYNLERQNLLLQKAAAEQAERERAAASARRKRGGGKRGKDIQPGGRHPGGQRGIRHDKHHQKYRKTEPKQHRQPIARLKKKALSVLLSARPWPVISGYPGW